MATTLFTQNTIALIWDFDKTLIPDYMQSPLFRRYGVNESAFWEETNKLAARYRERGYHLSPEISYLNHLLTYVLAGPFKGLNNKLLFECGADIRFYPGLPQFFIQAKSFVREKAEYVKHDISLEHYIVSTGLAPMIRGSAIASQVDGIWACEFIENPLQPGFIHQKEFSLEASSEIAQIGMVIDNTTKTRAIFEINKGTNKNPAIEAKPEEFAQNDALRRSGRIDHYGPADYTDNSSTAQWLRMHVHDICDRIVADREAAVALKASKPPRHLNPTPEQEAARRAANAPKQASFLE